MPKPNRNTTIVGISLPPGIHERMKEIAQESEMTISELVRHSFLLYELQYRKNKKKLEKYVKVAQ